MTFTMLATRAATRGTNETNKELIFGFSIEFD